MLLLGPLGFATPWLLAGLATLPLLWLILRATPPAPREIWFPGTALLAGLADRSPVARRTPWWLLVLRLAAVAAAILAFSGPVWRPDPAALGRSGPLLVLVDAGWSAAPNWSATRARATVALEAAGRDGRPVALLLADGQTAGPLAFAEPAAPLARLRAASPAAWPTAYPDDPAAALTLAAAGVETLWLTDGIDHPGRAGWLAALAARGRVTVVPPAAPVRALQLVPGPQPALRLSATAPGEAAILALGPDPQGIPRTLARLTPGAAQTRDGITVAPVILDLPPELRNRVTRFEVEGSASAGAVVLADDAVRRRKVGLVGPGAIDEGQSLLSPLHYLREALSPGADLVEGSLSDVLAASPDVIVLADVLVEPEQAALPDWVAEGGLLIRFAGPRMAAAETLNADPLLPVRLRPGGRDIGGALSWGDPRGLVPFPQDGPFAGLATSAEVSVRAQLMAEPAPELAQHTLAQLTDSTPLVTRAAVEAGQVVLFHVTASPAWSDLPLSGLFVAMLDRLVASAAVQAAPETGEDAPFWTLEQAIDGFGRPLDNVAGLAPVAAAEFAKGPGPGRPAGLYAAGARRRALNAGAPLILAQWPGARVEATAQLPGQPLTGPLLALALLLLAVDAIGSAALARGRRRLAA